MAICKLMIASFHGELNRYYNGKNGTLNYDIYNLEEGIDFANWCLEEGIKKTPTPPVWNCKKFIKWAKKEITILKEK